MVITQEETHETMKSSAEKKMWANQFNQIFAPMVVAVG